MPTTGTGERAGIPAEAIDIDHLQRVKTGSITGMTSHTIRRRLGRRLLTTAAALMLGLLTVTAVATPAHAGNAPIEAQRAYAIQPGETNASPWANVVSGGDWADIVYLDTTQTSHRKVWVTSANSFVEWADGLRYFQYRNTKNNKCLTHWSGILGTETCNASSSSQWWAVEEVITGYPPCTPPICLPPNTAQLMRVSNVHGQVVTDMHGVLGLTERSGPIGNSKQQLHVFRPIRIR